MAKRQVVEMKCYVADTGFLRSPELAAYLKDSSDNFVAICEYTCMECFQGDALVNIERSLQHLRHYPDQVLILRGAPEVVREQDKLGLAFTSNDLVDRAQTDHFAQFCRDIDAAVQGDSSLVHQIQLQGKAAATQLVTFRGGAVNVAKGIKGIAEKLDADRLKRIRNNAQFTASDIEWFLAVLKQLATIMIEDYPYATRWPEPDALRESWIFRYALAGCLLMRWWIQNGGLGSALGLGNDMIDMTIATNGTYFDGVWTKDNKLGDIHAEMRWVLEEGWKL